MSIKKCNPSGFHKQQHSKNTTCVFCGNEIKYNLTHKKHYTPLPKNPTEFKPTELTYKMVADTFLLTKELEEDAATVSPSNNPSEFTYKWFITNSS